MKQKKSIFSISGKITPFLQGKRKKVAAKRKKKDIADDYPLIYQKFWGTQFNGGRL